MRRPSWFLVAGFALAASTVAGYAWELVAALGCLPGVNCDEGLYYGGEYSKTVRLGNGGILAVAIAWGAFAQTTLRAALRSVLALLVFPVLAGLGVYGAWWVFDRLHDAMTRAREFVPVGGAYGVSVAVPPLAVGLIIPALLLAGASAYRASAATTAAHRRGFAVGALLLVAFDGLASLGDGAEVASVISLVSAAWLLWALQRARAHHERSDASGRRPDLGGGAPGPGLAVS